jgi:hypothetical protein
VETDGREIIQNGLPVEVELIEDVGSQHTGAMDRRTHSLVLFTQHDVKATPSQARA